MEYLNLILTFVAGGGLYGFLSWGLKRKTDKLVFADEAIKFSDGFALKLMTRIGVMEGEIKQLSKFKCERTECLIRLPQQAK